MKSPKLIPLSQWAEETFGQHAPHRTTLWRWISEGLIQPYPQKIGRTYFCSPNAQYVDHQTKTIERMIGNGRP